MKKFLMVVLLIIAMSTVTQAATFNDIDGLDCLPAVESLHHIGIVNGVTLNQYAPHKKVTRAELSKMIVSALAEETSNKKSFTDIKGHWGEAYIEQAAGLGILNGYTDGTFRPDKEVSYAEAIAILLRSIGYTNLDSVSGNWYDNYIAKTEENLINEGIEKINPVAIADRQDIAILLWNTIKWAGNGKSLLEKNFSDYNYISGQKVTDITIYNKRIVYRTAEGLYYVDDDIDFADLGGYLSGFYDSKNGTIIGHEIDSGKNYKKISGNTKLIKESGYEIFTCKNIMGYGDKDRAKYVTIFVDRKTGETQRVVFYDTKESHFAEKVKVGTKLVSIEAKDFYDTSIILLKDKSTITLKNLRSEAVKDIDVNALLINNGKLANWKDLPYKSVIREIKENLIYTFYHECIEADIEANDINIDRVYINNKEYAFADECVCENTVTQTVMKLNESFTTEILKAIAKKDTEEKFYLNEFGEVVKFEYTYDYFGIQDKKANEDEELKVKEELNRLGIARMIDSDSIEVSCTVRMVSLPDGHYFNYTTKKMDFKLGDLVYKNPSGDKNLSKVSSNTNYKYIKTILNYKGYIEDNRLSGFVVNDDTEYVEVLLERAKGKPGEYSKCTMSYIDASKLGEDTEYSKMHILVDKNNIVRRVYAIKETGSHYYVGIVKDIVKIMSGDTLVKEQILITNEEKSVDRFTLKNSEQISVGDLFTYELKLDNDIRSNSIVTVKEVFKHELIGNEKDIEVNRKYNGTLYFLNSDVSFNLRSNVLKLNGKEYDLSNYVFINATVAKNTERGEWCFKYVEVTNKSELNIISGNRLAVDELTNVIVMYSGYRD